MIDRFRGEYAFLSNFHPATIVAAGITFPTVEHAYQAAKVTTEMFAPLRREAQLAISELATPGEAKRWGRKLPLRADWEEVKAKVMWGCLKVKFADDGLLTRLLQTEPHRLVEGNDWGDTYWGVCRGVGKNQLGRMLMKIRSETVRQ